jgi:hypothetical protein
MKALDVLFSSSKRKRGLMQQRLQGTRALNWFSRRRFSFALSLARCRRKKEEENQTLSRKNPISLRL